MMPSHGKTPRTSCNSSAQTRTVIGAALSATTNSPKPSPQRTPTASMTTPTPFLGRRQRMRAPTGAQATQVTGHQASPPSRPPKRAAAMMHTVVNSTPRISRSSRLIAPRPPASLAAVS